MLTRTANVVLSLGLVILLMGHALGAGVPLQQYYGGADGVADNDQAQRLLINQQFKRQVMRNFEDSDGGLNLDSSNIKRLMAQKRFGITRQTRAGGVALCLWKVCPAGPWLVQKKK
ncbi:hypothetical protein FSP39_019910 [Pinctada imbricata]|uniref:EF-hand domain-containing protein n=1 Tax=Pinctada imbricata TaxID=66713 RepID=A0AA88YTR9_PINIB|nr:hypothetical protein FSP39_019910 [Pinctada imbricata]